MKNKNLLLGILALSLVLTMTVIGCDLFNNNDDDTAVTFSDVTANGSSSQTTTQLTLTFSKTITGLSASNITLSGVSGVSKGTLTSSGATYTLPISGFTAGGTLNVAVAKSGYTISGSPKTVPIYYYSGSSGGGTAPTITTATLLNGTVGTAYSQTLTATGDTPITWNLESGSTLPAGLSLTGSAISGTPTVAGTSTFTVKATNTAGSNTKQLSITITTAGSGGDNMTWTAVTDSTFGTSSIKAIVFGNNKFVAVGQNGKMAYSSDGVTWTAIPPGIPALIAGSNTFTSNINTIAHGNDKFVAGGKAGAISYSPDGITWKSVSSTFGTSEINAIAYGNNKFVAGGYIGTDYTIFSGKIATSPDGITWTTVSTDSTSGIDNINAIAYGNGKFVASGIVMVGDRADSSVNTGKMAYSSDGVTWTAVTDTTFDTSIIRTIIYGKNKFIAGGDNGKMATSTDGVTWTTVTASTFGRASIFGIAYGNNRFVAVGARCEIATSADGTTWTAVTDNPFGAYGTSYNAINAIAYGNNKFVAGGDGTIAYSSDGTGNNGGGGGSDVLNGTTWRATNSEGYYIVVTFNSTTNWSMEDNTNNGQIATHTGTYMVSGNTVTLTTLTFNGSASDVTMTTGTISGNTISVVGWPTFTKQ